MGERAMDSGDLEKERGITILSKCTALRWDVPGQKEPIVLNIVDTPGHADFGGEVERIMSMVDLVVLLVDATDGPMPQTKFVLQKALQRGLMPLVVMNKVDRETARISEVEDEIFDLFATLNASDAQMEYETIYASGKQGWASLELEDARDQGMLPLLTKLVECTPPPQVESAETAPDFSMLVSIIESDPKVHMGHVMYTGRVETGVLHTKDVVNVLSRDGTVRENARVMKILSRSGLERLEVDKAEAGNIVTLVGLNEGQVADTICNPRVSTPIDSIPVDPPTLSMLFGANTSPLAGQDGTKLLARQIRDRLIAEARSNVALTVTELAGGEMFEVGGRGELQMGILIETLRREGFELSVAAPRVVTKMDEDGTTELEPAEEVFIEVPEEISGMVVEKMQLRQGEMLNMELIDGGVCKLQFLCPSRGLIGLRSELMRESRGAATMNNVLHSYVPVTPQYRSLRKGAIISMAQGVSTTYSLEPLGARGTMFIGPREDCYDGQIIGESSKEDDFEVNPTKAKALTNFRAAGKDDFVQLAPPRKMMLEECIGYIQEDELLEVTPAAVRLRKKHLNKAARSKAQRDKKVSMQKSR